MNTTPVHSCFTMADMLVCKNHVCRCVRRNDKLSFGKKEKAISGALHLVLPGLTAGSQADEMQVNFKILNSLYIKTVNFSLHLTKVENYYSCTNAIW